MVSWLLYLEVMLKLYINEHINSQAGRRTSKQSVLEIDANINRVCIVTVRPVESEIL